MKNKTITLSEYFQILIKKIIETEAEQFDIPITHVHHSLSLWSAICTSIKSEWMGSACFYCPLIPS
jgi:hypothetical protein